MGYFLVRRLSAEEHHQFIAQSQVSEFKDFCLNGLLPIGELLHLILKIINFVLDLIDFLLHNLSELLSFRILVAEQLLISELFQPFRDRLEDNKTEQGCVLLVIQAHASCNVDSSDDVLVELCCYFLNIPVSCSSSAHWGTRNWVSFFDCCLGLSPKGQFWLILRLLRPVDIVHRVHIARRCKAIVTLI